MDIINLTRQNKTQAIVGEDYYQQFVYKDPDGAAIDISSGYTVAGVIKDSGGSTLVALPQTASLATTGIHSGGFANGVITIFLDSSDVAAAGDNTYTIKITDADPKTTPIFGGNFQFWTNPY